MARTLQRLLILVVCAALPLSAAFADTPTKDEVVGVVKKAIAYYKANGREKALAEFNNKDGQFAKGQDYVDIHDLKGVCLAHPTVPANVGRNVADEKDLNGKAWIRDIIADAKTQSSGWTRYVRRNPTNGKLQDKLAYWEVYDGLIFKAGLYME